MEREKQSESANMKTLKMELEWIKSTPKAKGNKSKARLSRYDELLLQSPGRDDEVRNRGEIYIPPGPRLGDVVVTAENLNKAFGEVRQSEERSDKLITSTLGTKFTHARTFVQDAPPPQPPQ